MVIVTWQMSHIMEKMFRRVKAVELDVLQTIFIPVLIVNCETMFLFQISVALIKWAAQYLITEYNQHVAKLSE